MELVLEDKGCYFCKKCTSVLNMRDSVLYFILLSKYYYYPNISDCEFKKLFLQKYLCTRCAFKIENVAKFINNLIIRDLQLEVSEAKCNMCNDEYNCLYPVEDLSNGFHDKLKMLTDIVLKVNNVNPCWKICLKCSYCVVSWSDIWNCIRDIIEHTKKPIDVEKSHSASKDINSEISPPETVVDENQNVSQNSCQNIIYIIDLLNKSENSVDNQQTKEIIDLTADESISNQICDKSLKNPENDEKAEAPQNGDIIRSITINKAKASNLSKNRTNMIRNPFCIKDIIRKRFENKVQKKDRNKTSAINVSDKIKHLNSVGDQTINNWRKITSEIASNKQLMIAIPYVWLERAELSQYTCSICDKIFTTKAQTLIHEVNHSVAISPRVRLTKTAYPDLQDMNDNVLPTTTSSCTDMLTNLCEVVYSDEEDSNTQTTNSVSNLRLVHPNVRFIINNKITRNAPVADESSFSAQPGTNDIIHKMHNYSYFKQPNRMPGGTERFQNVYQMYLIQHQLVPMRTDLAQASQSESVLKTMLNSRFHNIIQQEKVSEEERPTIRVRTDLF